MLRHAPHTILIADDDADDRLLTINALREVMSAARVLCFASGSDALEYFDTAGGAHGVSLALVDLNMPRLDGVAMTRALRARKLAVPVVVLGTSRERGDIERCYLAGANAYLSKPSSSGELVQQFASLARFWLETAVLPA